MRVRDRRCRLGKSQNCWGNAKFLENKQMRTELRWSILSGLSGKGVKEMCQGAPRPGPWLGPDSKGLVLWSKAGFPPPGLVPLA